jgi:hypothetical protein
MSADLTHFSADVPLTYRRRTADVTRSHTLGHFPLTYRRRTADLPLTFPLTPPPLKGCSVPAWSRTANLGVRPVRTPGGVRD